MILNIRDHEYKAIVVALISTELNHFKKADEYGKEGGTFMKDTHFNQANYYYDLRNNIEQQIKSQ